MFFNMLVQNLPITSGIKVHMLLILLTLCLRKPYGISRLLKAPSPGMAGSEEISPAKFFPPPTAAAIDFDVVRGPLSRFKKPIPGSTCKSQTGTAVSLPGPPLSTFALSHATLDDESAASVRVENNGNPSPISQEGKKLT